MQIVEETRHARSAFQATVRPSFEESSPAWRNVRSGNGEAEAMSIEVAFERSNASQAIEGAAMDAFRIEFISAGACELERDGERFELPAGSLFCAWPGSRYRLTPTGPTELDRFRIDATGSGVAPLLLSSFGDSLAPRRVAQYRWIHDLVRQIQDASEKGGPRAASISSCLFRALIERASQLEEGDRNCQSLAESTYERCRACLSAHFKTLKGIGDLAVKCNVSSAYLSRLFKRYANSTPSQLLAQHKMNHAAELLKSENWMVKEVANLVGYDDPYYFSRSFKQYFGVSPKRFAYEASRS